MSNYAPDPDYSQILLPFLSQLPTAFSSPKPPPTLPPLLAPITRARLHHLSFNNNRPWPVYLTWSSSDSGNDLYEHLMEQDYYFLHTEFLPSLYCARGVQRLDRDTLHAAVEIPDIGLSVMFLYVSGDDIEPASGWKVFDVKLLDTDIHDEKDWRPTVSQAEELYKTMHPQTVGKSGSARKDVGVVDAEKVNGTTAGYSVGIGGTSDPAGAIGEQNDDDDDDDYWGRYDEEDSESVGSPNEPTGPAETDDEYYNRYSKVQLAMDPDNPTPTAFPNSNNEHDDIHAPMPIPLNHQFRPESMTTSLNTDTANAITTQPSAIPPLHTNLSNNDNNNNMNISSSPPSLTPSHTTHSTPITHHSQTTTTANMQKLESQATEMNEKFETAIKQHVSTSMKSLYRLWKVSGLEKEEFDAAIKTELEVLAIMEEADGLGS